jgi:hypothetical protein
MFSHLTLKRKEKEKDSLELPNITSAKAKGLGASNYLKEMF